MADTVRIGGATVDREEARRAAESYLTEPGLYGYPAYDRFDGGDESQLSDGDLMTPGLLGVHVRLKAFYSLEKMRPDLEAWLARVPADQRLVHGEDAGIEALSDLFRLLDNDVEWIGGTTLAKVMHRKRPALVPLYDRYVWRCYVGVPGAPIERVRKRSWQEFVRLLAVAVAADLDREAEWLDEIAAIAANPTITRLRALDIVAWQTGHRADVIDDEADEDPNLAEPDDSEDSRARPS